MQGFILDLVEKVFFFYPKNIKLPLYKIVLSL